MNFNAAYGNTAHIITLIRSLQNTIWNIAFTTNILQI
jgi:hypothetical protein